MGNMRFKYSLDKVYRSLFQDKFSVLRHNLNLALRSGYSVESLFEIILCDFMKRIKNCPEMSGKSVALIMAARAIEYLGGLQEISNDKYKK